jgi:hypothetical protein
MMEKDRSVVAVNARKTEIVRKAMGVDYDKYESGSIAFDYEAMMNDTGYTLEDNIRIQRHFNVGNTPVFELHNLTALARKLAGPGKGARIFIKDEASNPAGSFKERRAATSVYHAKKMGYKGVVASTSGNYGAAVASAGRHAGHSSASSSRSAMTPTASASPRSSKRPASARPSAPRCCS